MFESFRKTNKEEEVKASPEESVEQLWDELEFDSLPEANTVAELVNTNPDKKDLINTLQTSLGISIGRIQIPPSLSESITLYVYKEGRDPNKGTEDFQLNLKKTEEGYEWSSAMKYNGNK